MYVSFVLAILMLGSVFMVACNNGKDGDQDGGDNSLPTSIRVEDVELSVGQVAALKATVEYSNVRLEGDVKFELVDNTIGAVLDGDQVSSQMAGEISYKAKLQNLESNVAKITFVTSAETFLHTLNDEGLGYILIGSNETLNGNVMIPTTYLGLPVVGIGDSAFENQSNMDNITIPNTVTFIGEYAFAQCSMLKSIVLPNSVTSIGDHAFDSCGDLESVELGDKLASIGAFAFSYCTSLQNLTIPNSVTSIGNGAFGFCNSFTSIALPSGLTEIANSLFFGCALLQTVTIPDSVTTIGEQAFMDCKELKNLVLPNTLTSISNNAFVECKSIESITIPSSVTSLGAMVFVNWTLNQTIYVQGYSTAPSGWDSQWNAQSNAKVVWNA